MVKRLILTLLMAVGGTGVYIYSSGPSSPNKETTAQEIATTATGGESTSPGGWQVEYVDGEGNPIQRDSGLRAVRIKATSNSLLKRIPGFSSKRGSDTPTGG